jgi:hypothetical protein
MVTTYQVGELINRKTNDPEFTTLQDATATALRDSDIDPFTVYGVWTGQDHGSELVAIAYQGTLFTSTN